MARSLESVTAIVRKAARELVGADGATFVLREGNECLYLDEDAMAPLWKGQRFPMSDCLSGWVMLNGRCAAIDDIYADSRVPADAYQPTFVKSLVMVPIREENPIGAIGTYWARQYQATADEIELLQALANTTAVALESSRLYTELHEQAALLDLARDAILVGDLNGTIRYWNKGAEDLHGWKSAEVIGKRTTEFLYADTEWLAPAIEKLLERGEWSGEVRKRTKSGGEVVTLTHWSLVREARHSGSILSISTDITDKKQLEAQFLRAQRLESLGALAGGIAHDLNNVLTPIMMAAELLLEEPRPDARAELTSTLKTCATRGAEMISQILAFARGTGGEWVPISPAALVQEVCQLLQATFAKAIQFQAIVEPNLPLIQGNPTQLHQVFMNLAVNARDAMPGGGTLTFDARHVDLSAYVSKAEPKPISGQFIAIAVRDTGHGMNAHTVNQLFVPFFTTKRDGKGTGLGLATVLGIVKSHGGFVEVASDLGRGSTFTVHLPVRQPDPCINRENGL